MSSLGRYEIRGEVGRGNMGVVYRGYDPVIDRMVAIKTVVLPENLSAEMRENFLERFLLEARIAGKLLHPNIVVTYDAASDETTGVPFIVMELVEGECLSERLRNRGALPWKEALEIVIPLARALGYAHERGIVHRDIKPSNVILTAQGVPKIADFGIAKLPTVDHTQPGTIMGTPHFMSPEQLMGKKLDGRSDIFSLGVLLYRSVGGRLPFDGPEVTSIVTQVLHKNPRPVSELKPEVPLGLDGVLSRALEKDPERRYGTAEALVEDLRAVEHGDEPLGALSTGEPTRLAEVSPGAPDPPPSVASPRPPARHRFGRRPILWSGISLALVVSLAVLMFLWVHRQSGMSLPLDLAATHHHAVGGCSGRLLLDEWGIEYRSAEHGTWRWEWSHIVRVERSDPSSLSIETRESELMGLVKNKRYNFTLSGGGLSDELWGEYQMLARAAAPDPAEAALSEESASPSPIPRESSADTPTEADLFHSATVAFENGDLGESQRNLEELLGRNPDFDGAAELLRDVDVLLWKESLPLVFAARHNHRIGNCKGTLRLTDWGIEYLSEEHGAWRWKFDEIRLMERPDRWRLEIETNETELLALGRPKSYKFDLLDVPLEEPTWRRYLRLAQTTKSNQPSGWPPERL